MSVFKRWNGTSWETIGPQISSARFDDTNHMIAPEYSSTSTYNVGDYVVQSDRLYKCISAIESAEEWTAAHWTQVSMSGEVSDLNSALSDDYESLQFPIAAGTICYRDGFLWKAKDEIETQEAWTVGHWQIIKCMGESSNNGDRIAYIESLFKQGIEQTIIASGNMGLAWQAQTFYYTGKGDKIHTGSHSSLSCACAGRVNKGDIFLITAKRAGVDSLVVTDYDGIICDSLPTTDSLGRYDLAQYIVPVNGIMYINTVTNDYVSSEDGRFRLIKITKTLNSVADFSLVKESVEQLTEQLPKRYDRVDIVGPTDSRWESGFFYSGSIGNKIGKYKYAALLCFKYGKVKKGDTFYLRNRSAGSGYGIYITDDYYTVLDYYDKTNETGYYDFEYPYVVPADGIMYLNGHSGFVSPTGKYSLQQLKISYGASGSPLAGIKWVSFGDSICEFNSTANKNWIKNMIAATGVDNTNIASSGTGFYRGRELNGSVPNNYIAKIASIPSDVEFITVNGSFNDLSAGPWPELPVGTADDTGETTLAGYMNAFFDALLSAYPTTPIAVMITSPWIYYRPGGERSDAYVSVLEQICLKRGLPFNKDSYLGSNLRPWITANREYYFKHPDGSVDNVHPGDAGHVLIYRILRPFLERCVSSTT